MCAWAHEKKIKNRLQSCGSALAACVCAPRPGLSSGPGPGCLPRWGTAGVELKSRRKKRRRRAVVVAVLVLLLLSGPALVSQPVAHPQNERTLLDGYLEQVL